MRIKILQPSKVLMLVCLLAGNLISLSGLQMPVYLKWRSSMSYLVYDLSSPETSRLQQVYKINAGVDTLLFNCIRTRVEITNRENLLDSQVVFSQALLDYQGGNYFLQASIRGFGYGNDFFLYNRRFGDAEYDRHVLLDYRWQGLQAGYGNTADFIRVGAGGNDLNMFLAESCFQHARENYGVRMYGLYCHKDSRYSVNAMDFGAEVIASTGKFKAAAGYNYHYIPNSKHLPEMNGLRLISQLEYRPFLNAGLIGSLDMKQDSDQDTPAFLYEGCLQLTKSNLEGNLGLRSQDIFAYKAYTGFLDINYTFRGLFTVGCFADFVSKTHGNSYVKAGLQTRFSLD